jgi:hypothetical protein
MRVTMEVSRIEVQVSFDKLDIDPHHLFHLPSRKLKI